MQIVLQKQIRENVYERALEGSGRDRLTMAHELWHLLFHEKSNISYSRMDASEVPTYRNPEWQADAFAGELLMPHDLIQGKSLNTIVKECKVSAKAALCLNDPPKMVHCSTLKILND